MIDNDKIDVTDEHDNLTRKLNMLETVSRLARETVDPETFGVIAVIGTYSFVRTSWTQRMLHRFSWS